MQQDSQRVSADRATLLPEARTGHHCMYSNKTSVKTLAQNLCHSSEITASQLYGPECNVNLESSVFIFI